MAERCDVLVVGLGPAGASAAHAAARGGARVLAIDRKPCPGEPVQCAEFLPRALAAEARAPGVVRQRVSTLRSHVLDGMPIDMDAPGLLLDRAAFDRALAAQAGGAGARLISRARLSAFDARARVAAISTTRGTLEVRYRCLIAADGPSSRVAAGLGLASLQTVRARQYRVPLMQPMTHTEVWLSPDCPGGYAWLFPCGAHANLGVGCLAGHDLCALLDDLHARLVASGRVGHDVLARSGGHIPVSGLRDPLCHGETLFAGDAGGFTHPVSGAGIAAAVRSGTAAGQAASAWLGGRQEALGAYGRSMRELFGPAYAHALRRRKMLEEPGSMRDLRFGWIGFPEYRPGFARAA